MEAALRWLADATLATAEPLRLMDATPVPCGHSAVTARRSDLYGYAGYGYCASHSRWYWGCKLLLICTCDGTVTGFSLANPKLHGERDQARRSWNASRRTGPRPAPPSSRTRACPGRDTEEFFAGDDLGLTLIRPARKDEKQPRPFPNWLRQRVEAVIWTLKSQFGLERHGGRLPGGLWARIIQRLLALNAVHLAQLTHRGTCQALPDRLRPRMTSAIIPRYGAGTASDDGAANGLGRGGADADGGGQVQLEDVDPDQHRQRDVHPDQARPAGG